MNVLRHWLRLLYIGRVFVRYGLDDLVLHLPALHRFRLLYFFLPGYWLGRRYWREKSRGERLRSLLADLGPMYVKIGQLLSTRYDLFPEDIIEELSLLCDQVPPFPGTQARAIVEESLQRPWSEVFSSFDETALASASVAQAHAARLVDGREVIVKVVRPGIQRQINDDINHLRVLAAALEKYDVTGARKLKPSNVVRELHKTLLNEMDMMREGANASQLRRHFVDDDRLQVPHIVWEHTSATALVMERVEGIPVDEHRQLKAAGYDLTEVARVGVTMFFTQLFRDGFFHADLHSGNIFIGRNERGEVQCRLVDFGIMGSLSDRDMLYLNNNLDALLERDYRRVALLHIHSGWVPLDTRVDEFEYAVRTVLEPLLDRPLSEVSMGRTLWSLLQTARQFDMEILPQFLLLQKTLINVEGMARHLAPDMDLWKEVRPLVGEWMSERVGIRPVWRMMKRNSRLWTSDLEFLLPRAMRLLQKLDRLPVPGTEKSERPRDVWLLAAGVIVCLLAVVSIWTPAGWPGNPADQLPPAVLVAGLVYFLRR